MDRRPAAIAVVLLALTGAACGDPLIVLGDAPGLMRAVIGIGDSIGTRVDSLATRTRLTEPGAVAFDDERALLYVADRGALSQVQGINTRVARIFSVASDGTATLLLDAGGCSGGICIVQPVDMALAADGSLIIADAAGHRVFRYSPGGQPVVLAGTGAAASGADGALAAQSPLNRPTGVAMAPDGRIFVSEATANRVRVIGADGRLGTVATVAEPAGLDYADGTLYIAEYVGAAVSAMDANGVVSRIAGIGAEGYSGDGGPASAARLNRPYDVAVNAEGRALFISEYGNHRVRTVDLLTGVIRTFAGTGDTQFTGSRRSAGETALFRPTGLHASDSGFLFIVDTGHSVVWRTAISQ